MIFPFVTHNSGAGPCNSEILIFRQLTIHYYTIIYLRIYFLVRKPFSLQIQLHLESVQIYHIQDGFNPSSILASTQKKALVPSTKRLKKRYFPSGVTRGNETVLPLLISGPA